MDEVDYKVQINPSDGKYTFSGRRSASATGTATATSADDRTA